MTKWRKGAVRVLAAVLIPILVANLTVIAVGWRPYSDGIADAVVVPGAGIRGGKPSPILRDRLDAALSLYRAGCAGRILVSGGHSGTYYDEAAAMEDYLLKSGVPAEDILTDRFGFDTYSTAYRAARVFGCGSCIVVTQRYHLYRGVFCARMLGMDAVGFACEGRTSSGEMTYYQCREIFSRVKAVFDVLCGRIPAQEKDFLQ